MFSSIVVASCSHPPHNIVRERQRLSRKKDLKHATGMSACAMLGIHDVFDVTVTHSYAADILAFSLCLCEDRPNIELVLVISPRKSCPKLSACLSLILCC